MLTEQIWNLGNQGKLFKGSCSMGLVILRVKYPVLLLFRFGFCTEHHAPPRHSYVTKGRWLEYLVPTLKGRGSVCKGCSYAYGFQVVGWAVRVVSCIPDKWV